MIGGPGARVWIGSIALALALLGTMALGCAVMYQAAEWWMDWEPRVPQMMDWSPRDRATN
jgi:hypothetical protein